MLIPLLVLKTGLTPSASGSAYLEIEPSSTSEARGRPRTSGLKLTCTVHGPKPLPRSAPFSAQLLLSTRIKFAPFATRQRRGYVPDPIERDLAAHLETALRGVLLAERWPKSGVDVIITVLESEEDGPLGERANVPENWGVMNTLSGCITVASAALTDGGIDCVDLVTGGVAAFVSQPDEPSQLVLDPCPSDHKFIDGACVVAYLQSRDELTEVWAKGCGKASSGKEHIRVDFDALVENAIEAASAARLVLVDAVKESAESKARALQLEKTTLTSKE